MKLITELATVHPELATWAQTKLLEGWTEEGIRERLLTIMHVARPVGDEGDPKDMESRIGREDDFVFTTAIPARMIADLFVTAVEGGIGYWCEEITAKNWTKPDARTSWWYDDEVYLGGDRFEIKVVPEGEEPVYVKGHTAIERGLVNLAHKYPHHMEAILADNHDAATADAFLQCVVFGEIVYG